MFVWDIATGKVEKEWVPSIEGASPTPHIISGTSFGPDGLLWAAYDGTLFAVDPDTQEIVKAKRYTKAWRNTATGVRCIFAGARTASCI